MGLELGKYTKSEFAKVIEPGCDNTCVCTLWKRAKGNPMYLKQIQHKSYNREDDFSEIATSTKYVDPKK